MRRLLCVIYCDFDGESHLRLCPQSNYSSSFNGFVERKMDSSPLLSQESKSEMSFKVKWNKADIYKLAICWALTLTTSTLLTVIIHHVFIHFLLELLMESDLAYTCFCFRPSVPWLLLKLECLTPWRHLPSAYFSWGQPSPQCPLGTSLENLADLEVQLTYLDCFWCTISVMTFSLDWLGFTIGCLSQMLGSFLGVGAMYLNDKTLLFMGCLCVGLGQVILILRNVQRDDDGFVC